MMQTGKIESNQIKMGVMEAGAGVEEATGNQAGSGYEAIVIAGIGPGTERAVQRFLERRGMQALVFRTEEVRVWEPYGSLARSIVAALVRYPQIGEIWVLGQQSDGEPEQILQPAGDVSAQVCEYVLPHLSGLPAESWLQVSADETTTGLRTAELLRNHPLLPRSVKVTAALLEADGGVQVLG